MNNATIFKIGVILYALVIGYFGVNHLMHATDMAGWVPDFMPGGGKLWIYITGVCLVLAAISFLIGKYTMIAGLLLAVFLVIIVLTIHVPDYNHATDASAKNLSQAMILKDIAMAAGALMVAGKG